MHPTRRCNLHCQRQAVAAAAAAANLPTARRSSTYPPTHHCPRAPCLRAVKLNANRHVTGVLRGFDQFMNLVLDNAIDEKLKADLGMVVSLLLCWRQALFWDGSSRVGCGSSGLGLGVGWGG